jgi:pimeloyl-ACP methyl ester carboxylesterase
VTDNELALWDPVPLPSRIESRIIAGVNGLDMHVLQAGHRQGDRPPILLLHGFPELAYSWRKIILPLADAGFHVIAPDQRGYGRTTGCPSGYDDDLAPFRITNLVTDMVWLLSALGHKSVAAVVGHDFGSSVAASCALMRPDVFRSAILMSAPFAGPPALPFDTVGKISPQCINLTPEDDPIHDALRNLERPRKHYQKYFASRQAGSDMRNCSQGVQAFLRAYYHHKSANWRRNEPFPLQSWSAQELAKMPTYYIMDLDKDMAATAAAEMPSAEQIAACRWLTEEELAFYTREYERTGFQGGLQWYRIRMNGSLRDGLALFSGKTIDVPSMFLAGACDWGAYQIPGGMDQMQNLWCTRMWRRELIPGAGHWVQQERPFEVTRHLLEFLKEQIGLP